MRSLHLQLTWELTDTVKTMKSLYIELKAELTTECAGLLSVSWKTPKHEHIVHMLMRPGYWSFGRHHDEVVDGQSWDCGPFFSYCRTHG